MDSRTAARDEEEGHNNTIGSTEPRPAALGGRLDFNEADDFAPSATDLLEQRSGPPSAESVYGESSTSHPCYANPARPKVVDVDLQVDLDSRNIEEQLVACKDDDANRFNTTTQLLSNHDYVTIIALDFSKAFDTFRHSALFDKFADLEIPDNVYNWLVEFFQGHSHIVPDMNTDLLL